ncbi:spermatogenesis-associated protein 4 [Rhizophlyctis rosea]|nr:spermatogenesis-associated protein 4 [Rhizophlyctis rosea]
MTGLRRDILKWVQSLDLTYSIKNTKRDFANGFLIAEILSKYHPLEVSMHCFDTGTGMKAKKGNWDVLGRVFSKLSIPVPQQLCNEIMQARPDAAGVLLEILHAHVIRRFNNGLSDSTPLPPASLPLPLASSNPKLSGPKAEPRLAKRPSKKSLTRDASGGSKIVVANASVAEGVVDPDEERNGAVGDVGSAGSAKKEEERADKVCVEGFGDFATPTACAPVQQLSLHHAKRRCYEPYWRHWASLFMAEHRIEVNMAHQLQPSQMLQYQLVS